MLKALRTIVSIAATMIIQSSDPREFLRAHSLKAVVMTLGMMKIAAGMRSTLPILSSVGRGSQAGEEDMMVTKQKSTERYSGDSQASKGVLRQCNLAEDTPDLVVLVLDGRGVLPLRKLSDETLHPCSIPISAMKYLDKSR